MEAVLGFSAEFVVAQTGVGVAALVPEVELHLASEVTPLWYATEEALARDGVPPPYWAFAWAGGQALARFVLDRGEIVRGRRVLDFAAGSGIVGIAAARAGAAEVTLADIDPFAAAAGELNAARNGVRVGVTTRDLTAGGNGDWDVILAGDVCYERGMVERVLPWLRGQAALGKTVLIGDPGRSYCPGDDIEEMGRYIVPTSLDLEGRETRRTRVLRLLPSTQRGASTGG